MAAIIVQNSNCLHHLSPEIIFGARDIRVVFMTDDGKQTELFRGEFFSEDKLKRRLNSRGIQSCV